MPSVAHESLVDLFRERPALALDLLCSVTGTYFAEQGKPSITSAEFSDLEPAEYRADVVVRLDDENGEATEAFIVEVQLDRDTGKRYSWPLYEAGVRARLRCQATVMVIAIDPGVAAWCAKPITLSRGGSVTRPIVLGPDELPRIRDMELAREQPELAILSVAAHGNEEDAAEIALAALDACRGLDSSRSTRYADFVLSSLGEAARRALETLMSLQKYEYQSDFAKKYYNQGRDEGRDEVRDSVKALLLKLLAQRFDELPERVRERVQKGRAG